jgi:hypothetical protein
MINFNKNKSRTPILWGTGYDYHPIFNLSKLINNNISANQIKSPAEKAIKPNWKFWP